MSRPRPNTLVGYSTREEVRQVFESSLKGIEHTVESFDAIEERAVFLDNLFRNYQDRQDELAPRVSELREAKQLFETGTFSVAFRPGQLF